MRQFFFLLLKVKCKKIIITGISFEPHILYKFLRTLEIIARKSAGYISITCPVFADGVYTYNVYDAHLSHVYTE